jgi:hypothetical protein
MKHCPPMMWGSLVLTWFWSSNHRIWDRTHLLGYDAASNTGQMNCGQLQCVILVWKHIFLDSVLWPHYLGPPLGHLKDVAGVKHVVEHVKKAAC